ncbi:hypothetical protein ACLOJK_008861 [Asimina triloba]
MAQESLQETLDSPVESDDQSAAAAADHSSSESAATAAAAGASSSAADPSLGRSVSFSRLNARAPEFVPRATTNRADLPSHQQHPPRVAIPQPAMPVVHVYPSPNSPFHAPPLQNHGSVQYYGGLVDGDGAQVPLPPDPSPAPARDGLPDEVIQKVVNQGMAVLEILFQEELGERMLESNYQEMRIKKGILGFLYACLKPGFKVADKLQAIETLYNSCFILVSNLCIVKHDHLTLVESTGEACTGSSASIVQYTLNVDISAAYADFDMVFVEYYFSDVNLATTDHLRRFINKDPEGYVPISVVAAFKKIKALVNSNPLLARALRTSSKLVVSDDGKKVRRQHPFTEADVEELQSRIVVAENLPEDHSYQNLMKIFSAVGSVKAIRTCPPQATNGAVPASSRSGKVDMPLANKLHAFVEYESIDLAEKAVAELNNERNWRSGLKVRLLLRRTTRPSRGRKQENDWIGEEDDVSTSEQPSEKLGEDFQPSESSHEHAGEEGSNNGLLDKESGARRAGRARGRGKGRGRGQHYNNRGGHPVGTPPSNNSMLNDQPALSKQPPGPRMPDGTRGFTFGRGKPLSGFRGSCPSFRAK